MKQITNKEYEEYQKYKTDKLYGRVLTPDGFRLIGASENYDPAANMSRIPHRSRKLTSISVS